MNKTDSIILGMITGGIGGFLLQATAVFIFALIGAFAGFVFAEYIKPWLKLKFDKLFKRKD